MMLCIIGTLAAAINSTFDPIVPSLHRFCFEITALPSPSKYLSASQVVSWTLIQQVFRRTAEFAPKGKYTLCS